MLKLWNRLALAILVLPLTAFVAIAVTVDIDIVSKGEPVPAAEITFETADGTEVTPQPSLPPAAETPAVPDKKAEPGKIETTTATTGQETENKLRTTQIDLPDDVIGKPLTLVVKKDGEVVKRQKVVLQEGSNRIPVEAFDPADAKVSIALNQRKTCRCGRTCEIDVSVTNKGIGIYKGPLFVIGEVQGSLRIAKEAKEELACGIGIGGQPICQTVVSLEPDEVVRWPISLSIPPRVAAKARNCVELIKPGMLAQEGRGSLIQAVQLALQLKGFTQSNADGRPGPKTLAAIEKFEDGSTAANPPNFAELYQKLYTQAPSELAKLALGTERECEALKLICEVAVKKPTATSTKKQKTATRQKTKNQKKRPTTTYDDDDDDDDDGGVGGVGIQIGVGIGTGGSKDRYNRKKKKKIEDEFKDED